MIGKVLIANRGEIALRVARTCRELGIRTVAAHSTDDRDSAAVRYCDEAIQIGPAPARRSYLNIAALAEAALRTGADAVHPGYGFLSEDPDFAEVCEDNGIVFIGPPARVMARLGDKIAARALMAEAGLPMLPGSPDPVSSPEEALKVAGDIGYPVVIKAAAGGGGRGMRLVRESAEMPAAFNETRSAAQDLFGDGRVFIERYLTGSRHVEIQVVADRHGDVVHLGERDCSAQRRYQKLVEESPAPALPAGLVKEMADAALRGAAAAGYVGAGTFEFLVDDAGHFYFLEVNCRIQVEHPVTEMVYGVDLVREQLRIAAGRRLSWRQEDLTPRGHAIECRVNAEDVSRGFTPAPGILDVFAPPAGPFVRVDTHGYPGYRIPASYDSLLAKLIVWGRRRDEALSRMDRALTEFRITGVPTTVNFLREIIRSPSYRAARHDTNLVQHLLAGRTAAGHTNGSDS